METNLGSYDASGSGELRAQSNESEPKWRNARTVAHRYASRCRCLTGAPPERHTAKCNEMTAAIEELIRELNGSE